MCFIYFGVKGCNKAGKQEEFLCSTAHNSTNLMWFLTWKGLKLKHLDGGFDSYKHVTFHFTRH